MAVNQTHAIDIAQVSCAAAAALLPPLSPKLRICRCGAAFLPRQRQKSCSPTCARQAQPPRSAQRPLNHNLPIVLRLLNIQPLERRARGGWRFGTKAVSDVLAASLIASGRAEIRGDKLHPVSKEA